MSSILAKIDLIGKDFKFKINRDKYRTSLGGVISIMLILSIIIACGYFGQDIYFHHNPNYYQKQQLVERYPIQPLSNSNFFFALAIQDSNNNLIDDKSYFVHQFTYYRWDRNLTTKKMILTKKTVVEMDRCNTTHLNNSYFIQNRSLSEYYCPTINNLDLGGDFVTSDQYYLFKFSVDRCNSITEKKHNIKCKTNEEVVEKWKGENHIASYIQKTKIDQTNYYTPIEYFYDYRYENYDIESLKENRLFYTQSELITDAGLIFSETTFQEPFLLLDSINSDYYTVNDSSLNSMKFYIQLNNSYSYHHRSYITLQQLAAVVGGLMNVVFEVLTYIYGIYADNHLDLYMYNNLFDITENETSTSTPLGDNNEEMKHEPVYLKLYSNRNNNNRSSNGNPDKHSNNIELNNLAMQDREGDKDSSQLPVLQPDRTHLAQPAHASHHAHSILNDDNIVKQDKHLINKPLSKNQGLNKDIKRYIKYKQIKRKKIEIDFCTNCIYKRFCHNSKDAKFRIIHLVEEELNKKIDILNLLKNIDQLNTANKFFLNKNQSFMLRNKKLKNVCVNPTNNIDDYNDLLKKVDVEQKKELTLYLNNKLQSNNMTDFDTLLFVDLSEEIKLSIKEDLVV